MSPGFIQIFYFVLYLVNATAIVFVAVGVSRVAKVLESMNVTTMDVAETAKRIEKAQTQGR